MFTELNVVAMAGRVMALNIEKEESRSCYRLLAASLHKHPTKRIFLRPTLENSMAKGAFHRKMGWHNTRFDVLSSFFPAQIKNHNNKNTHTCRRKAEEQGSNCACSLNTIGGIFHTAQQITSYQH